jgi:hypothetical protein
VCGIESEADKKVDLNKDEINIGTPYYYKSNQYTLLLKMVTQYAGGPLLVRVDTAMETFSLSA